MQVKKNEYEARLADLRGRLAARRLDAALVFDPANVRALTGIVCDNACLKVLPKGARGRGVVFYTDFRYVPMVRRVAPWITLRDISKVAFEGRRIGYESSITVARYQRLRKGRGRTVFVDILDDLHALRAMKTASERDALRAAEALNDAIWQEASVQFRAGMTERQMARLIQHLMIERGEGEAFDTIVCVGANAAECHHVPDDTVWNGREPLLVDMGVKLNGFCSDMTRCLKPGSRPVQTAASAGRRARAGLYEKVYDLVLEANRAAIAAACPGITCRELDAVARDFLAQHGYGKAFGHSLGHGVGLEIHEAPAVSRRSETVLKPGMAVTIEPGVYLEGNLGVRIEDLVLITEDGCEVISHSRK